MNAVTLTLFVSGVLVLGMLLLFGFLLRQHTHEQSDRLSLLPLQDEIPTYTPGSARRAAASRQTRNAK